MASLRVPELVPYGDHPSQVCERFAGAGGGPRPVAVLVHGGFWRERYGRELQWGIARDLVARGWTAWNVEYRRLGGGGGYPQTLEDVGAAVDALADAGEALDRVVAIGHSAGAQLALWAAARPGARVRLTGAVSQGGALDLRELHRLGSSDGVVRELLGGAPDEVPDRYADASPIERLPVGVPLLVTHGGRDEVIPASMSVAFAEAAGDGCALAVVDREAHYEHLEPGSELWEAVVRWLER